MSEKTVDGDRRDWGEDTTGELKRTSKSVRFGHRVFRYTFTMADIYKSVLFHGVEKNKIRDGRIYETILPSSFGKGFDTDYFKQ